MHSHVISSATKQTPSVHLQAYFIIMVPLCDICSHLQFLTNIHTPQRNLLRHHLHMAVRQRFQVPGIPAQNTGPFIQLSIQVPQAPVKYMWVRAPSAPVWLWHMHTPRSGHMCSLGICTPQPVTHPSACT
mmetsp:Transcript_20098/g.52310  ORF Transcript_20098/g.52310 Transcript_20098/m.52310 type:complete len:130 (+) Transcript_20098:422-811(+)